MTGSQRYCHDGNTQAVGDARNARPFDPAAWLAAFEQIGGGYALDAAGKLWLLTDRCTGLDLLEVMSLVTGNRDRVEAVMAAVVARSGREAL